MAPEKDTITILYFTPFKEFEWGLSDSHDWEKLEGADTDYGSVP